MKRFARILIGLTILAGGIAFSGLLWVTRPKAEKEAYVERIPVVEVQPVHFEEMTFNIPSQGIVEATRRSRIATAVAGKVIEVNPLFDVGNRVPEGAWLVKIDPVDYLAARASAAAVLTNAQGALAEEQARAAQAKRDWLKLGNGGEASDLAARGPQLRSAEAQAESARAMLAKAASDLERVEIRAPFDCVIASTATEVGNYLAPGALVSEVFETRYEIRLPLSVDQLQFLQLNEQGNPAGDVEIMSTIGGNTVIYKGRIVRTEGEIDRSSRSAYLVAEVAPGVTGTIGLQPGLFVKAVIAGQPIRERARIPFAAFVDLERVAIVAPDNTLQLRDVKVVFRDEDSAYISGGLKEGELICLTELPAMITGQKVSPKPSAPSSRATEEEPAPKPTQ